MAEGGATPREQLEAAIAAADSSRSGRGAAPPIEDLKLAKEQFADVDWSNLAFTRCDFGGAGFQRAKLDGAVFKACRFPAADFTDANLNGSEFLDDCNLENATLLRVQATDAKFIGAILKKATAVEAVLVGADFSGAELKEAHFERADLRGALNLSLDRTFIQNAQFSHYAADSWSRLRRTYTGPRFLLNLLFPGLFIVFVAAKTYGLWAIAILEQAVLGSGGTDACARAGIRCDSVPIWQIVTGWNAGLFSGLFVSASLLYNGLRLAMTLEVASMRDEEDRTGRSPRRSCRILKGLIGYECLETAHRGLRLFQWATFALSVAGWWELLGTELVIPGRA